MNKRLLLSLYDRSGLGAYMPVDFKGHELQVEEHMEKFAELIVRECAKFCDEVIKEVEIAMEQCEMVKTSDRLMMLHDGTRNGAQMSKIRIKKHFGVEE